jgi:peroxiredoxin
VIQQGDPAPEFTLSGTDGNDIAEYSLSEHLETGPVVLAFYPQDFSPACTEELCTLHEGDYFEFVPGVDILGLSTDGVYSHREFIQAHGLGFPLLSDGEATAAADYGVKYDQPREEYAGSVTKRSLFIVDGDGVVQHAWSTDDPFEQPDLLAAKARLDEIVPA